MLTTSFFRLKQNLKLYGLVFKVNQREGTSLQYASWMEIWWAFLLLLICSTRCGDVQLGKLLSHSCGFVYLRISQTKRLSFLV